MTISGKTSLYGLLGYPLGHTASPAMHNASFKALGIDAIYLAFSAEPKRLAAAFKGLCSLGVKGLNVTIPHKQSIIKHLDRIDREAALIGAVNTVVFDKEGATCGYNTDGRGFLASLKEKWNFRIKGKRMVVLGAGGGSRGICVASALAGAKSITLFDVDKKRASRLAADIEGNVDGCTCHVASSLDACGSAIQESHLLVNATPVGMKPDDPLLLDPGLLPKGLHVVDLIYNPRRTKLLDVAKKAHCNVQNGLGMLVNQGALSFSLWTGQKPDKALMRRRALNLIGH